MVIIDIVATTPIYIMCHLSIHNYVYYLQTSENVIGNVSQEISTNVIIETPKFGSFYPWIISLSFYWFNKIFKAGSPGEWLIAARLYFLLGKEDSLEFAFN
jgi:hypothetical protein